MKFNLRLEAAVERCRKRGPLFLVYAVHHLEGSQIMMVQPLIVTVVSSFLKADGIEGESYQSQLTTNTAVLFSVFFWTCAMSGLCWGMVADRCGRRVAMLFGLTFCCLSNILFAISTSFPVAVLARILAGLDGNLGVNKVYVGDLVEPDYQPQAFSYLELGYAISTITAPLMGSVLPGQHIPGLGYAPAFWPGFYAATLAFVLLVLCAIFLPETCARRTPDDAVQREVDSGGVLVSTVSESHIVEPGLSSHAVCSVLSFVTTYRIELLSIAMYSSVAYVMCGSDTLIALGVEGERDAGGMGLSKAFTGRFLYVQGFIRTGAALLIFPIIASAKGAPFTFRIGVTILATVVGLLYVPTLMSDFSGKVTMFFITGFRGLAQNLGVTAAIMLVSNSAYKHSRGWTLGACQSIGSLSRGLGTFSLPLIYDFARKADFLLLPYLVVSGCGFLILLSSLLLPNSLRYPREFASRNGMELELVETAETKDMNV